MRRAAPARESARLLLLKTHLFHGFFVGVATVAAPALAALTLTAPCAAQYGTSSPWEASVRELRRATTYANDGSHHPRLVALRQLHDPALRPLFQSLVQGKHWTIQIDGILGLAELDPKGKVDPFLLGQLKGETDRSTGIGAAVGLDMVGVEQAETMLAWDDLPPRDRVMLMGELLRHGGTPDEARLRTLAEHRNDEVAGMATLLIASMTKDPKAIESYRSRFGALPTKEREIALAGLASASLRFRLAGAVPFLSGTLQDAALSSDAKLVAISALLQLDPTVGYDAWKSAVAADAGPANRVRLALVALGSDTTLPKDAAQPLREIPAGETLDPLMASLADAIDAVAGSGDPTVAMPALVKTKHRPSLAALLEATKRLGSDAQRATYDAFVELVCAAERREISPAVAELAIEAIARLGTLDPAAVDARLTAIGAEGKDTKAHDLLLLALLQANTREAAAVAMKARPKATRRGAALALLLHARFASSLEKSEVEELGVIAAGGWSLDPGLEVQAAWLYARHSGRADEAIATILKP